ncbi:SDR family NAD(P)-dependent oxidoreductase [Puniceibacterium sediminis]|uniref:Short-chain dehydrogenase n=1 Tax=Puniceibacterium sediminis TaxID=1608407 RepID=A0A238ZPA3_9RHOB|nr:SDR family NAD(P)-dependent oxidoreductase [Puniceibacterium sediminis]SNR84544.1 Short-chain dehydrogenase [Puniceibacterium sediminis]
MTKIILITGATDGLGRATAQALAELGHSLIIHGRNADKLAATAEALRATGAKIVTAQADLSDLVQVAEMARKVVDAEPRLDVLINNAGVLKVGDPLTADGQDLRFVVNTFAPALLTSLLLPIMPTNGRLVHLSSAAQAPVDLDALSGRRRLEAMEAYAQSKLALTIWSQAFAAEHPEGPVSVAVNPGSLLATNMVREGFGMVGNDINIGVNILTRAALSDEFATASGRYYDNDARQFSKPHHQATAPDEVRTIVKAIRERISAQL